MSDLYTDFDECDRHARALRSVAFLVGYATDISGQAQEDLGALLYVLVEPLVEHVNKATETFYDTLRMTKPPQA